MKHRYCNLAGLCAAAILACLTATTGAGPIFTENFNSYSGNQNNTQYQTGLNVAHSGNVTGWSKSGDGTMHAVDLSGAGNWAIMFWQNNVITLGSGIAANTGEVTYQVDFDCGTAVYAATNPEQATTAADGLLVEVLRADNSVLASAICTPGDGPIQATPTSAPGSTASFRMSVTDREMFGSGSGRPEHWTVDALKG